MSRLLIPYIGSTSAVNTFGKCDTGTQDLGANYQAYIDTKVYSPWGDNSAGTIMGGQLVALASAGVTTTVTTTVDFGLQSVSDTVLLTAAGSETRVQPRIGGSVALSGGYVVQFRVGDSAAANTAWQIDELTMIWRKEGPVVA